MAEKPTYQELEKRVGELDRKLAQRKQTEEALRASAKKYRHLVENANEAILVAQAGTFVFTNEKGENLFGYSGDELASRPLTDFIHEEDRELVKERHERRLKGEILPDIYPFKIICKAGEVKWVELKVARFSWEDKPSTLCFFTDITEQKVAETALRESEENYRNLFSTAQVGLARTRISDGKVLECNQKMAEIFGYESVENFITEYVFSDNYVDSQLRERMLEEVKKTGILNNFEAEFYAKDKSKIWARFDTRILPEKGYMEDVVVDITEQKVAETALRESEEKYRRIFENSVVGFFQSIPEGRFLSVNPAFAEMLGYESPDELIAQISDIATQYYANPEDRRRYKQILQKSKTVKSFEFKVKRKDGSQIWVSNSTRAYFNQDGTVDHYEGIVIDITERKQAEKALWYEREQLLSIFDSIDEVIYLSDPNTYEILYANKAMKDAFQKDLVGGLCYREFQGFDSPCHFCTNDIILKQKYATYHWEYHNPVLDKDYAIIDRIIKWPDGRDVRFELAIDISERKRVGDALKESEAKHRIVLEANPDPVVVYDMTGTVTYLNPAFTQVFGWSLKERIGKKLDVFVPDQAWPETKMMIDKVIAGEAFSGLETHRYTKEGRLIPVSISAATYRDLEDNQVGTVVNLRDISEQKRLEAQLQKAQKLEAIGILAGGLAHDFNNILAAIVGNIDLAKYEIRPEVGISENLSEAEKASFRAKELTKQLITFSKGGEPIKVIGSIGDLVKETTSLNISGSKARCEFSPPENLWLAEFDEGQMKHAIKNLIDNAIEAMPDGGSIDVVAENVEIDSETKESSLPLSKGKYIKIAISDTGIGISEDHLSKIFDPYFSTKEMGVQKGMGMGLATAYSIINRHKGHIIAESESGVGTTFALYLPAAVEEIVGKEPVKRIEPGKHTVLTGRILVMDDEEMIRKLATKVLNRLGYEPELAQDGAEAIELYKRAMNSDKPFDAVILDLTVKGGMGGKDAVKELLEINPQVKAIVSSGYSNDPEMTAFKKYGFVGTLPKPYAMNDLKDVLNKVILE